MSDIKQGLAQFRQERKDMEARLRNAIVDEIDAFYEKTGVQVSGMRVSMTRIDLVGMPPDFLVGAVDVDTAID